MNLHLGQRQHLHQRERNVQSISLWNLLYRLLVYIRRSSRYFHLCLELLIQGLLHIDHR